MIQLGLRRSAQLFTHNPQPWKAVHVAGTNGKGTICTYLSAMLHAAGIRCGRFTSPHLIDRWDCISIDEKPVAESLFREVEAQVLERNKQEEINATEFELLTATAFDIFTREKIEVGVVEVGMGGKEDATNVLKSKAATIIANIGLDHQSSLGNTVEEIAKQKCGIFMKDVPVFYNSTNNPSIVKIIEAEAKSVGARPIYAPVRLPGGSSPKWKKFGKQLVGRKAHRMGIACAYQALRLFYPLPINRSTPEKKKIMNAIMNTVVPGRFQNINIKPMTGIDKDVLIDGAHNEQAAKLLSRYVKEQLRYRHEFDQDRSVAWVLAATKGKDFRSIVKHLINKSDSVAAVEFGSVDGMPWVQSTPSQDLVDVVHGVIPDLKSMSFGRDISGALRWATEQHDDSPVVVAGSLYLVSDILRSLRDAAQMDAEKS